MPIDPSLRAAIAEVVHQTALLLDEHHFEAWLALVDPEFHYRIEAYSPEIRKDMTWLEHDVAGLRELVRLLPKHNTDHGRLFRHVALATCTPQDDGREVAAVSSVAVYRTALDAADAHVHAGETSLFAIGRYHDRFVVGGAGPRLVRRAVRLETRSLSLGSHYPI